MSNSQKAASRVRAQFVEKNRPLTLGEIRADTGLEAPAISMALCYLMRQRYLTREQTSNKSVMGRKNVWEYTYHPERLA